ncbi:hypothetical protein RUND412_007152 [Rhizina undulata]
MKATKLLISIVNVKNINRLNKIRPPESDTAKFDLSEPRQEKMGDNLSGLNPEGITFGIEVEVASAGLKNKQRSLPKCVVPPYALDQEAEDQAIATGGNEARDPWRCGDCVPSFPPFPGAKLETADFPAVQNPSGNYLLQFNESTGLHVHVGYGDRVIPLPAFLNIAAVLVIFEPVIDKIHVGHRGVAKPNMFVNSNRNKALFDGLTNLQVVERINECKTVKDLQNLVNHSADIHLGDSRWFKYNVMSLTVIGTIEFRQHAGIGDAEAVQNWILLCTTLVRRAAEIGGEAIKEFARKRELRVEDLRRLVHDPELINYYRGKLY